MLKTLRNAWKIKEIRTKLIFTFLMLVELNREEVFADIGDWLERRL